MTFNDLEKNWDRQILTGGSVVAKSLAHHLDSEIRHERRRIVGAMAAVAFAMIVGWGVTVAAHFTGIKPMNALAWVSTVVDLALNLAFFVLAARSVQSIQADLKSAGETLVDSVHASLRTIDSRLRDTTLAVWGLPAGALLSVVLFLVKYLAGDLRGLGAATGSVGTFAFVGTIAAAMWWRRKTHLLPRREELRQLLASLEQTV